jgi:hypothetical protein
MAASDQHYATAIFNQLRVPSTILRGECLVGSQRRCGRYAKRLTENRTPLLMFISYTDSRIAQNSFKLFYCNHFYFNIFCFNLLRLYYVDTLSYENTRNIKTICYIPHFLCYFLIRTFD